MQQHRGVQRLAQLGSDGDVVVMPVRAHHRYHMPAADRLDDRLRVMRGVEHHDLGVVADHPDVVVDVPTAAVELEGAAGDQPLDRAAVHDSPFFAQALTGFCSSRKRSLCLPFFAQALITESPQDRRTSPACIL